MTVLILIGLIPFAALGILLGHLLTVDSIGPAMGGGISLLALLGGTWFPIADHGFLHDLAPVLPSYWLVQAEPRRARRRRLGRARLVRDRRLDGRPQRTRAARLPARHRTGIARPPLPLPQSH